MFSKGSQYVLPHYILKVTIMVSEKMKNLGNALKLSALMMITSIFTNGCSSDKQMEDALNFINQERKEMVGSIAFVKGLTTREQQIEYLEDLRKDAKSSHLIDAVKKNVELNLQKNTSDISTYLNEFIKNENLLKNFPKEIIDRAYERTLKVAYSNELPSDLERNKQIFMTHLEEESGSENLTTE